MIEHVEKFGKHTYCPAVISRLYPSSKIFFWVYPPPRWSKIQLTRLDTNFLAPAFLNQAGGIFLAKGQQKPFFLFSNLAFFYPLPWAGFMNSPLFFISKDVELA